MSEIIRIDRVVAEFDVWLGPAFPFAKMKLKIIDRNKAGFLATTNLHILNRSSRQPEYMAGIGATADEALQDALARFVDLVKEHAPEGGLAETDFIWSAPEDF